MSILADHPLTSRMVKKYGLPMLVTADESLKEYLSTILSQVQGLCCAFFGLCADLQNGS